MPKSGMAHPNLSVSPEITLLDRSDDSPTDLLYRAAVGPISADYYLPMLARFEKSGRAGWSWNWAACLYTLNWMAFRGLWTAALAYVGVMIFVPLLLLGIGRLVLQLSETAELTWLLVWGFLSFSVPGVLGNVALRSVLRQRMTRAITDSKNLVEACAILGNQASSRQRLIGLGVANLILVGAAVGFYLATPSDGMLARVGPEKAPARIAESGPVIDLTGSPALPVASALAAPSLPASESLPVVAAVPVATPLPAEPASAPQVNLQPSAVPAPQVAVAPQPLPQPAAPPTLTKPYFINVGLFAKETNARKAKATLQEVGLRPITQEIDMAQGKRTRLRAGPFDTLAKAEAAAEKIRSLKLEAQVLQP